MTTIDASFPPKLEMLFHPSRYKVAWGGRGAAKSWGFARALLIQGLERPMRILCAREVQKSIKDSVHQLLCDQITALGLEGKYEVLQTEIRGRNGTRFLFSGLSDQTATSLKSFEGVDVCWVEEAHTVTKRSWNILTPTIRKEDENNTSEIWVSFNPELDTDETYQRFVVDPPEDAVVVNINYADNPWFPNVLRKEMEDLRRRDPVEAENVWDGKPKAVVAGAIYKDEIAALHATQRVRNVPYDPALRVHCVYDLGWNDSLAIVMVQRVASEVRVIDYIEDSHRTLDSYVIELQERRYNYGTDWIPHDGKAGTLASGGASTEKILKRLGRAVRVLPVDDVEEGIKGARLLLGRCYFDRTRTVRLLDCLKRYRRGVPISTGEPGAPVHDQYSHGADAFRYLGMCVDQMSNSNERKRVDLKQRPRNYYAEQQSGAWMS